MLTDPVAAQKALERIRAHLVDPGLLLMDLYVPAESVHPPGAPVVQVQTITLRYPDGPHDVESLAIDPDTGDAILVAKVLDTTKHANVYLIPRDQLRDGASVTATRHCASTANCLRAPLTSRCRSAPRQPFP